MKKRFSRAGVLTLAAASAATMLVLAPTAPAAHDGSAAASATTIIVWSDQNRKADVDKVTSAWGSARGVDVQVVVKDFGKIQTDLGTVDASAAPDVVVGASDWTGGFAANGLVVPLFPRKAVLSQFPQYALNAFSYGKNGAKLYGIPVSLAPFLPYEKEIGRAHV